MSRVLDVLPVVLSNYVLQGKVGRDMGNVLPIVENEVGIGYWRSIRMHVLDALSGGFFKVVPVLVGDVKKGRILWVTNNMVGVGVSIRFTEEEEGVLRELEELEKDLLEKYDFVGGEGDGFFDVYLCDILPSDRMLKIMGGADKVYRLGESIRSIMKGVLKGVRGVVIESEAGWGQKQDGIVYAMDVDSARLTFDNDGSCNPDVIYGNDDYYCYVNGWTPCELTEECYREIREGMYAGKRAYKWIS